MKLKPLFDRVVVLPIKQQTQTKSGITLSPDEEATKTGKIVALGEGVFRDGKFIEMKVKLDDIIVYEEHFSSKIIFENTVYHLLKQTDILAVLSEVENA